MVHRPVCLVMLGGLALFGGEVFAQTPCDGLANLQLPRTSITSATMVAAGPLSNAQRINVPAHCEVKGVTRPYYERSARSFHDFRKEEAKPPVRLPTSIACSWCLEWVTAAADTVRTDSIRSRRLKAGSKKALRRNR